MKTLLYCVVVFFVLAACNSGVEQADTARQPQPTEQPSQIEKPLLDTNTTADQQEVMPVYAGGNQALMQYIAQNVNYPEEALETGIEGKVFVEFVVQTDGSVADTKVLKGIGHGCDQEAQRVVASLSGFEPGRKAGKEAATKMVIPIVFKLTD